MTTIPLCLHDELNAALETLCQARGRDKNSLVEHLVRQFVEMEQLKQALQDPALMELYEELASEDKHLADQGITEYRRLLVQADHA